MSTSFYSSFLRIFYLVELLFVPTTVLLIIQNSAVVLKTTSKFRVPPMTLANCVFQSVYNAAVLSSVSRGKLVFNGDIRVMFVRFVSALVLSVSNDCFEQM